MKKTLILLPFIGALLYFSLSSYSSGPGAGGAGDRTGASGTFGCGGGGCHGTSASSGTSVLIELLDASTLTVVSNYTGSGNYIIRITGTSTGSSTFPTNMFGYQTSVVKNGTMTNAGTLSAPSGSHKGTYGGISIVEHSSPLSPTTGTGVSTTTYVVSIPWTAPSPGTGCLTIFAALNAVHYDGSADSHDQWNYNQLNITEALVAITGATTVCVGSTTTLSDATGCGSWSSGATGVATVDPSSGVVTGVSAGTATISYTSGGTVTTVVTVNALPANITGSTAVCVGSSGLLSDASGLGTWLSSNTAVATVNLITGNMTGVSANTASITFTAASNSCKITKTVTVNPLPSSISGPASLCPGVSSTLSDAGGGTWVSGNTSVATIGSSSGIVTPGVSGTSIITYTLPNTGCAGNITVTVNPIVSPITGSMIVCPGFTTALTDAGGGTWTSGNSSVATVVAGSGLVTGVSGGTSTITYTVGTGCTATATVTVNPLPPPITGTTSICAGLASSLTDATTGGTWTSTNTSIATIGSSSGLVTAASGPGGTTTISYTVPVTGCVNTTVVTVNPLPTGIIGTMNLCPGTSTTLSDATSPGTWTSSNTAVADINLTSAFVTGGVAGTSIITYMLGTGCIATSALTVNPSPPAISGIAIVCSGLTTGLSDTTSGGTWVSSNTSIATIGSSTGVVTAVGTFGISFITYTAPMTGCTAVRTLTVNALPAGISGTPVVCSGSTTIFSGGGGGTWSSSNTAVATVGTSGVVTGIGSGGSATITFTLNSTGCSTAKVVTVNLTPAAITGPGSVCVGSTVALSDVTSGGSWASSNPTAANIGSSSGIVTGLGAGGTSALITYTLNTGCKANATIVVNALPAGITGASAVCTGSSTTLSDGSASGNWSSNNTAVATVGSGSGVVTGSTAGSATISYTITSTGCSASKNVTVNPGASSITGTPLVCAGSATALSDGGGGTWKSSSTAIATVNGSGVVTGVSGGTSVITYTLPSSGCTATQAVTVNPLSPITGITSLCGGLSSSLSDATTGGTWTSSNTAVATIGSSSGFVTSGTAGSSIINYTLSTGCVATTTVNIVSAPSAITGNTNVCLGLTSALSDGGGGTWTSSKTAVATVGAGSGVVTGMSLGTATITYSLGTSCTVTANVTVNPVPTGITGTLSVCAGGTTALTDGSPGGTWSSSNANATVGSTGIVSGVSAGTSIISYTGSNGCAALKTVTVNPLPSPVTGADSVCMGSTTTLSDAGGGSWTSGTSGVATVTLSTGVVSPISTGTAVIVYTLPATGCSISTNVKVNPLPLSITGSTGVCVGATTALSDGSGGGTWSTSNTNTSVDLSGNVTGVNTGSSIIIYTLSTGCTAVKALTVNPLPAGIIGSPAACIGNATALSDGTGGGKWTSGNIGVATIGSTSGVAIGISADTTTIKYTLTTTGCSTAVTLTVNPLPLTITGTTFMCAGFSSALTDASGGGTWSSSNSAVAIVGSGSGVVTGMSGGTATVTYTLSTGCAATTTVTINPLPAGITGSSTVCSGAATALTDASTGGTWTSSNTGIATIVSGSGVATGVSAGTAIVTYALGTGCEAHYLLTVNPAPPAITGIPVVCAGAVTVLSDTTTGSWSSSNTAIATVGSGSGAVSGVFAGTATVVYTLPGGCSSSVAVTVNPLPAAISGVAHVCSGLSTALSDGTGGGTWSSGTTTVATIGSGSGVVTASGTGVTTITYTLTTGCTSTVDVTVNPLPSAITGTAHVCVGSTTALSDAGGGTWRSSNATVATVSGTGVVSGVIAGTATIVYTLPTGCNTSVIVTVNPMPVAGTIVGPGIVCMGTTNSLSDAIAGGTWTSSNAAVATVDAGTGIVTGVSVGFVDISYSVTNSCGTAHTSVSDTVIAIPGAGVITGSDTVCVGSTVDLGDTVTGGAWSSSNANASVSATGTITGVAVGTAVISYSKTTVCGTATATLLVTINPAASCKAGITALPGNAEFKVYPNPSKGEFIVEIPATLSGCTVTIMDVLGKVIETRNIIETQIQKVTFDLGNKSSGSYIVKVNAGDKTYREKIVIW